MKEFTEDEIIKYADKLLIALTDDEALTIQSEFAVIDKNIDQINLIDGLQGIEPMFMPYDLYVASFREDSPEESADIDDILSNTKDKLDREIRLPKVVE